MNISDRITIIRGKASRASFSDRLKIKENTLRNYEKALSLPNSDIIGRICHEFNISPVWLLFGSGPMHPGEQPQPAANAPEPPVTPVETASCARCAKMEAKVDALEEERRELSAERRKLSELNIKLFNENTELRVVNGDLKAKCATLEERQKHCCPDPPPAFIKKTESGGSPNCAQVCA